MDKFIIEITSDQLVALNAICTSIVVNNYDKLPSLKNEAKEIAKLSMDATISKNQKKELTKRNIEIVEETKISIPTEFFDTFNFYSENDELPLINNKENLRFIYGKQGQIGIEYWEDYKEGNKPDEVMFIKNSDAIKINTELKRIISALNSNKSLMSMSQEMADKYQFNISYKRTGEVDFSLYKKKDYGCMDEVAFANKDQLRVFCNFLEYHLN